jgi:excisionase family DNA binding protein
MIDMASDYIGISTAASIVGVTKERIRVFVRNNRIKAEEIDGRYLIEREEINRFKQIPRNPGKPRKKS